MKIHLLTLCGCTKTIDSADPHIYPVYSVPIHYPVKFSEPFPGKGTVNDKRNFELMRVDSAYENVYYEEVK